MTGRPYQFKHDPEERLTLKNALAYLALTVGTGFVLWIFLLAMET